MTTLRLWVRLQYQMTARRTRAGAWHTVNRACMGCSLQKDICCSPPPPPSCQTPPLALHWCLDALSMRARDQRQNKTTHQTKLACVNAHAHLPPTAAVCLRVKKIRKIRIMTAGFKLWNKTMKGNHSLRVLCYRSVDVMLRKNKFWDSPAILNLLYTQQSLIYSQSWFPACDRLRVE